MDFPEVVPEMFSQTQIVGAGKNKEEQYFIHYYLRLIDI